MGELRDYLVFFHIFFVALLVASIGITNYSSIKLHRTTDVREFGTYLNMGKTGGMIAPIAVVLASLLGVGAASEIAFIGLTDGWLIATYIAVGIAMVVPLVTFKPWGERAGALMPEAISKGEILPEQRQLVASRRYMAVELFMNGLLIFIFVMMVFKPGINAV